MDKVSQHLFNSPLEVGLRILFLFDETNKAIDTQRIIYYNYLLLHSADAGSESSSLHPCLPNRSCEILVNRKIILQGLSLLVSKGLIEVIYAKTGVVYKSSKRTADFLDYFESSYARKLKQRANWVISNFEKFSDRKLAAYMTENLGKWGSEFIREYSGGENE